jgi:hypothetical protein
MMYGLITFLFLLTVSLFAASESAPVVDDYQQTVQAFNVSSGRSTVTYERDLIHYKKCLHDLGAPVVSPSWLALIKRMATDAILFSAGGAVFGGAGFFANISMAQKLQRRGEDNTNALYLATGAGLVAGGVGSLIMYYLGKLIAGSINKKNAIDRMSAFLYDWPLYRSSWPQRFRDLIEPYYAQVSTNGLMILSRPQLYHLYLFLVTSLNARVIQLRKQSSILIMKERP